MTTKILLALVAVALFLGLAKLYGNSRYNEGIADQRQAVEDAAAAKRAEDATVTVPKIRRDANERKTRTAEVVTKAAAELPRDHCFNVPIDGGSAGRLRPSSGGPAAGTGPTPH